MSSQPTKEEVRSPLWRRVVVICGGSVILGIGIALLVLPGPALVFIPLGLAILASEFKWAKVLLARARQIVRRR